MIVTQLQLTRYAGRDGAEAPMYPLPESLARVRFQMIWGLRDMVDRGYIVAATDYPGLGTPQTHPYLVGVSEGRAVLNWCERRENPPAHRQVLASRSGGARAGTGSTAS
jgi:predicted dienelactone hydrolase